MKKSIFVLAMLLLLTAPAGVSAQRHRHHEPEEQVAAPADTTGIEAFSDTTSADSSAQAVPGARPYHDSDGEDWDSSFSSGWGLSGSDLKELLGIGVGGTLVAMLFLLFLIVVALAPFFLIGFVVWLLVRNRNRRYQLAEKAMESGQQIPEPLLDQRGHGDDDLWRKAIKNIFLGVGLAVLFYCWDNNFMAGIGWLLAFYGVGQAVISKTSSGRTGRQEQEPSARTDANMNGTIEQSE